MKNVLAPSWSSGREESRSQPGGRENTIMKHRLLSLAVTFAVMAGFLSVVVAEAPPAHASPTAVQPTKIAVVIMENQSAAGLTTCGTNSKFTNPYLCNSLVANANGLGTNAGYLYYGSTAGNFATSSHYFAGAEFMTVADPGYDKSAPNYVAQLTGDDCNGLATDEYFNNVGGVTNDPLTSGSPDNCGKSLLQMVDEAPNADYIVYAEDFSSGTAGGDHAIGCEEPFSDGDGNEYVRRHNSGVLFADDAADCVAGGNSGKVQNWPYPGGENLNGAPFNDNQNDERAVCANVTGSACDSPSGLRDDNGAWPFQDVTLPALTIVVPNNCHNMHTGTVKCTTDGDQFGEYDGSNTGTDAGSTISACTSWTTNPCSGGAGPRKFTGDFLLSKIVPNLQEDVGPTGVVIITFDEGSGTDIGRTTQGGNMIPTIILPGTESGVIKYKLAASGAPPTEDTDQAGLLAGLIAALSDRYDSGGTYINCDNINGQGDGETACNDAEAHAAFDDNNLLSNSPCRWP